MEQGHSDLIGVQPSGRCFQLHVPSFGVGPHAMTGAKVQMESNSGTFQFSLTHPQLHPHGGYPVTSEESERKSFSAFPYNSDPVRHLYMQRVTQPLQCFFCGEKQLDKGTLLNHLDQHDKQVTYEIDLLLEELSSGLGTDQTGQDFMLQRTPSGQQHTLDKDLFNHHPDEIQTGDSLGPSQVIMHRNSLETCLPVPITEVTSGSYSGVCTTAQPLQCTLRIDTTTMNVKIEDCIPHTWEPGDTERLKFLLEHQTTKPHKTDSLVEPCISSMSHDDEQALVQAAMKLLQATSCAKNFAPDESENQAEYTEDRCSSETMASNIPTSAVPPANRSISCYGWRTSSVPRVERHSISQNSENVSKPVSSLEISTPALSSGGRADHIEDVRSSYSADKAPSLSAPLDKVCAPAVSCTEEPRLANTSKTPLDCDVYITNVWTQLELQKESVTCAHETSNGTSQAQLSEELAVSSDKAEYSVPSTVKAVPRPDTYRLKDAKHKEDVAWKLSQHESTAKTATAASMYENDHDSPDTLSDDSLAGAPSNENETWSCSLCSKVLSCKSSLERHRLLAHLDDNTRQCSLCFEVMPDVSSLNRHNLLVHPEGKKTVGRKAESWKCSACSAELSTRSNLQRHQYKMHANVNTWKCSVCSSLLPSWSSLARHRRIVHGQTWECSLCSKALSCKASLDRHHLVMHSERQPLKCPHCDKTFGWKQTLNDHIYSHTGEKPFECHLCPNMFARRSALWMHLQSHANYRRFACHLCPSAFLTRNHLTRHLRSHRKVKDYECSVCFARLSTSYGLSRHLIKMHNNHRPHGCAICGERFWKIKELDVHLRECRPLSDMQTQSRFEPGGQLLT